MIPDFKAGQRVQHKGMAGTDQTARVWRLTRHGLWVTMPDGSRQQWHPEDVAIIPASDSARHTGG